MLNVRLPEMDGMIGELQLHHAYFYMRKHKSHQIYKIARLFVLEGTGKRNVVYNLARALLNTKQLILLDAKKKKGAASNAKDGETKVVGGSGGMPSPKEHAFQMARTFDGLYEQEAARSGDELTREDFGKVLREAAELFERRTAELAKRA
jgi:hypothetical protein